ncbi:hypothetical protein PHMEG_00021704 [Phytophthora megakarya]|uniref:Uncharacterized protein n=1 Tax=Phytophthora megakarya TaxID=4795 RepID=A0A225VL79_9STRA|nr:hypothetical protein PHMEG_00021704 [Phytophthora megakarya]
MWSGDDCTISQVYGRLPSHVIAKNDKYSCSMATHRGRTYDISEPGHTMRTIFKRCSSERCEQSDTECTGRYKNYCSQASTLICVYQEGEHSAELDGSSSPRQLAMTPAMKMYVQVRLSSNRSITAHILFMEIAVTVKSKEIQKPASQKDKVRGLVNRWRDKPRDDSMRPVEEMCAQFMVELTENITQTGDDMIVFCDSRRSNGQLVPELGDASYECPFCMALTSFSHILSSTRSSMNHNSPR